jgi:predicted extracellular nuclease
MSARAHAVSPDVVISQVYGGGGNSGATLRNDFIELFNRGGVAVNLSTWSVQYGPAAAGSWQRTNLTGVIQPGQYFLVQEAMGAAGTVNLPTPDAIGTIAMGANSGIVALVNTQTTLPGGCAIGNASLVDLVGYGATTCAELASTAQLAATTAAIRSNGGCTDSDSNQADFGVSAPTPRNTSSPLGSCAELAPAVTGSSPANGATNVSPGTTISVSFSEPVSVAAGAVRVECPSGTLVASNAGALGPVTNLTIEPAQDLPIGSCRVLVQASGISDSDASDPPDHPAADFIATFTASFASCAAADTPIGQIQGTGTSAALTGVRTVQGVVVADYETPNPSLSANYLRGFFLQNAPSAGDDGNPNTSDGIFVFSGDSNFVKVGEVVQVTGNVVEFNFGLGGGPTLTELSSPTIEICGSGASLTPTDVTLPFGDATTLERYEGMLVRFPQTLYVTEHFQLGRFGQILVSSGNRLQTPTSAADPGAPALAVEAANSLNTLIVDDDLQLQNPDPIRLGRGGGPMTAMNPLRGGDTIANLMGVLTQTDATSDSNVTPTNDPAVYRLRPFNVLGEVNPNFQAVNLRPAVPVVTTGSLKVAGFNLLNYFNTFGTTACKFGVGGATAECRGAENQTEFDRQWPKTVAAAIGTGADVLVVNEMENDGYAADSALQDLVNRLNTATAPGTYTFIPVDANVGQTNALGTDAIKVGIIYKPAKATPIGSTAALNTGAFGIFQTASEGNIGRSRPALAQAFSDSCGGKVVVVGNHLKSKGSSCEGNISPVPSDPDALDGQGNCNLTRKAAAEQLLSWLGTDPTHTSVSNVLILGDFNSYSHEDPIKAIVTGGYTNLIASEIGPDAYSYVFDGGWGYLDYAFASPSLLNQIDDVVEMHINADEPGVLDYNTNFKSAGQLVSLYANDAFRASDHDPVVVGLTLTCAASHGVPATRDWHTTLLLLTLLLFGAAAVSARRFVQR